MSVDKIKQQSPKQIIEKISMKHFFAPSYYPTVLVAKICTNHHERSVQILWYNHSSLCQRDEDKKSFIRLTPGGAAESGFLGKRLAVVRRRAETERRRVGRRVGQVAVGVHLESSFKVS
jgi:hypothetical protein